MAHSLLARGFRLHEKAPVLVGRFNIMSLSPPLVLALIRVMQMLSTVLFKNNSPSLGFFVNFIV